MALRLLCPCEWVCDKCGKVERGTIQLEAWNGLHLPLWMTLPHEWARVQPLQLWCGSCLKAVAHGGT